jgi:hypothetical protein
MRIGVLADFNWGAGIESVHPRGKAIYDGGSKKGDVQEVVAKVISAEAFVMTDLAAALERTQVRLSPPSPAPVAAAIPDDAEDDGDASSDDGAVDNAHATCAYATGALVPDVLVSIVSGQIPQLLRLLRALWPPFCANYNGAASPVSPLASRFNSFRCSLRLSLKLCRRNVCRRLLQVVPESMIDDPYAALHVCAAAS